MVLLAMIVLGGVVAALFGYVSTGQRTARQDRDFNQAIQVADAGIQTAFSDLAVADPDDPTLPAIGATIEDSGDDRGRHVVVDRDSGQPHPLARAIGRRVRRR